MKNEMQHLLPAELVSLARVCQAMLIMLNARMFTLLSMISSAVLFGWVMMQPDWIRFAGACAFSVLVFFPLHRLESARIAKQESQHDLS